MVVHVLGRDRGFLVATEFLVLCCDRGSLCLAWFSGYRQLLGRNIVFLCRDSALFLYCDDVAIEVFLFATKTTMTRGQVMQ